MQRTYHKDFSVGELELITGYIKNYKKMLEAYPVQNDNLSEELQIIDLVILDFEHLKYTDEEEETYIDANEMPF